MGEISNTPVNLFVTEFGVAIDFKSKHLAFTFAKLSRHLCQSAM
ncbi:MAG: hypothetical protein RL109_1221 [Pseudomonadota bacterium]|jgi:hypothetical protein